MSKVRTSDQPVPEHTHATEFHNKIESNAKAAQVHGEVLRHSYESVLPVEDAAEESHPQGTEVGGMGAGPGSDALQNDKNRS